MARVQRTAYRQSQIGRYPAVVASDLRACPFCRELFTPEEVDICPECDVVLRPLRDLPPSYEVQEAEAVKWEQTPVEDRQLPVTYWSSGRGALLVAAILGLGLFFGPWIELTKPDIATYSGWTLASSKGFWFGGGAIGWFISIPLVFTRRTLNQMRGVRIVTTFFAATTALQCLLLMLNQPTSKFVPVAFSWGWAFYASAVVSVLAIPIAVRFGHCAEDLPENPERRTLSDNVQESDISTASEDNRTLH